MFQFKVQKHLLMLMFLCAPLGLWAQSSLDSLQHLQEVVIIAKPFKEVIPAQRLNGLQLEKLSSHSVADALRYFSGVKIKDYGGMGGLKTIDVRNMGSHHVGVFFDGIEVGNAQNGVVDLGRFSLDNMEELSLYNGQRSEIFQSAKDFASASAIYLNTRKPRFRADKKTNVTFRYKAGSIQLTNPSLTVEHKFSKHLSASVSGEYIHSNGRYKFRYKRLKLDGTVAYDTTAIRKNSDIDAFRLEAGLFGNFSNGFWKTKVYYYQSDRGLPGAIVKNEFSNGERQGDKNFFLQSSVNVDVTDKFKTKLNAKFAYDYTHYLSRDSVEFLHEYVTKKMQFDNSYYQQDFYISSANCYSILPNWDVNLSLDFQYNKLNATMRGVGARFSFPQRYTLLSALATAVDLGKVKAQASLLGTFVTEKVKYNVASPDKKELTPAFFIGYKPFSEADLNLRFFYKRIFRMPTFNDLYYAQIGSSNLSPEYTNQFNLGATYAKNFKKSWIDFLSLKADVYYAAIDDKIIASPTGSSFRWMMTNMGFVETKGVDASAKVAGHISEVKWNVNLSYGYSKAQDFTKINGKKMSSYGDQIPYTPWHSGSVITNFNYKSWGLNYSFIYVGKRYNGAVNNIERNSVQPWYTHDLSLEKSLKWGEHNFKLSVEVNNLLNQYYDVVLNYPMPGRNFKFVLTYKL